VALKSSQAHPKRKGVGVTGVQPLVQIEIFCRH